MARKPWLELTIVGAMNKLLLLALCGSAIELTKDNFDDATAGKTVFIKFLAPW